MGVASNPGTPSCGGPGPQRPEIERNPTFDVSQTDADLELAEGLARDAVMSAVEGHIIGEGKVTGIFEREG